MARFSPIPVLDVEGLPDNQALALNALKENVELLTGLRGGRADNMRALLRGDINISRFQPAPAPGIANRNMTVQGQGFEINGAQVPTMSDFVRLVNDVVVIKRDVEALLTEIYETRQALSALIEQLRS